MAPHRSSIVVVLVLIGILFCSDVIHFAQGATVTIMKENHITAVEGSGEARHLRGEDVSAIEMPNNDDDTTMNLQGGSIGPLQFVQRYTGTFGVCPKLNEMESPSSLADGICYQGGQFYSGYTDAAALFQPSCGIDGMISLFSQDGCAGAYKLTQGPGFCFVLNDETGQSFVNMCCGVGCLDEIPLK